MIRSAEKQTRGLLGTNLQVPSSNKEHKNEVGWVQRAHSHTHAPPSLEIYLFIYFFKIQCQCPMQTQSPRDTPIPIPRIPNKAQSTPFSFFKTAPGSAHLISCGWCCWTATAGWALFNLQRKTPCRVTAILPRRCCCCIFCSLVVLVCRRWRCSRCAPAGLVLFRFRRFPLLLCPLAPQSHTKSR